jgi:hypothetical protein
MNPQMLTESARIRTTVAEDIAIGSQSQSPDLQVYMQGVMLNGFVATALTSRNPATTGRRGAWARNVSMFSRSAIIGAEAASLAAAMQRCGPLCPRQHIDVHRLST